jgi:cysteine synthase A
MGPSRQRRCSSSERPRRHALGPHLEAQDRHALADDRENPLLAVDVNFRGRKLTVYAKCEHANLTGSIKDRMELHIVKSAYAQGTLQPGQRIVEATTGNTGISFAALGSALGHPVTIFMPDWMSEERKNLVRSYGADLVLVSKTQGGFRDAIGMAEAFAQNENVFLPKQFSNHANIDAHQATTGPEISQQPALLDLSADAFVAGVGTGGTVMGVGRYLRSENANVRVYPAEPLESPTLSTGSRNGEHCIQGISDDFVPPILNLLELDPVTAISGADAIAMARRLARVGLAVGISSGCNLLAALRVKEELDRDATVATVFANDNKKYLSTDLVREEPARPEHLTRHVEVLGFSTVWRCSIESWS